MKATDPDSLNHFLIQQLFGLGVGTGHFEALGLPEECGDKGAVRVSISSAIKANGLELEFGQARVYEKGILRPAIYRSSDEAFQSLPLIENVLVRKDGEDCLSLHATNGSVIMFYLAGDDYAFEDQQIRPNSDKAATSEDMEHIKQSLKEICEAIADELDRGEPIAQEESIDGECDSLYQRFGVQLKRVGFTPESHEEIGSGDCHIPFQIKSTLYVGDLTVIYYQVRVSEDNVTEQESTDYMLDNTGECQVCNKDEESYLGDPPDEMLDTAVEEDIEDLDELEQSEQSARQYPDVDTFFQSMDLFEIIEIGTADENFKERSVYIEFRNGHIKECVAQNDPGFIATEKSQCIEDIALLTVPLMMNGRNGYKNSRELINSIVGKLVEVRDKEYSERES